MSRENLPRPDPLSLVETSPLSSSSSRLSKPLDRRRLRIARHSPHWRPPPVGSIKVNVNGAFLPSARLGAIGVIARDSSGAVLGGFAKPIPSQGPASTMEAAALFAGLEFAIANNWPSAHIESDAAVLVNKLHRPTVDLSLLGDMLAPSRALLTANAARFRVGFTTRLANIAAHTLASWACNNNDVITFSSVCPEFISRGNRKPHHQLTDFRECLLRNDLADCKPSRGWFTWMQSGPRTAPIRERLDRFIADSDWHLTFPTFRAWSEYSSNSDHHFILLDTVAPLHGPEARGQDSTFRFDECWAREPECISMVQSLWAHSTGPFPDRLATICEGLRHWQSTKRTTTDWERIPPLKSPVEIKEAYWAQRSRVLWLSAGDQNTSFFHAKASARKKKNAILGLYDCDGRWHTSTTTEVLRVASDYFGSLFSANSPVDAPAFLEHITPSVSADMNSGLLASFTAEEVIAAFRDINPRKSPGIDGLPSGFFLSATLGSSGRGLCLPLSRPASWEY
ncbi:hypothetical protein GQ457_09G017390 [Hibiscus cannabinus]